MKVLLFLVSLALSWTAAASSEKYDVRVEMFVNGTKVSQTRLVSESGQTAIAKQSKPSGESALVEMVATEFKDPKAAMPAINMKFKVRYTDAKKQVVSANLALVAANGQSGEVGVVDPSTSTKIELHVIGARL